MLAGATRIVAVLILMSALVGGGFLSAHAQAREQAALDNQRLIAATHELQQDRQRVSEQERVGRAARRHIEAEAKGKADEVGRMLADTVKAADEEAAKAAEKKSKPYDGPIPTSCQEYTGNQAAGCALLLQAGFGLAEMPCLSKLWMKESGWRTDARNPSSGAYGIPQALPGSKMGPDWQTSAETQIRWGLGYIKSRYGTPCGAWNYFNQVGWY